ncbi:MAG: family 20 glycosylhydrolase [Eubacteriales bacterium]|nr:family 20 glycosylhydrolase [Candidatus Colimorpha enterica]
MKKKIISVLTVLAIIIGTVPLGIMPVFAASSGTAVASTPAVRSSVTKSGTFTLTSAARLFIVSDADPTGSDLGTYVQTASSVLAAKNIPTSSPLTIVYGRESAAQAGDIVIRTDSSATGHRGGYVLDISAGGISITADDAEGVLYALTTLAQTCTSGTVLKCTTVTDWPDVAERSVYLDCGRIYFAPATLKALIRTMAWNRMNVLYLDFSNNNATRFLLDDMDVTVGGMTYDITTAAPSDGYLTQSDMDDIIDEANRYGVQIIPTFNSPGHIGGIRSVNTSFFRSASASDYDSATGKVALNILDQTAYAFGQAVVKLYVDYFASKGCRSFNIAADEVTDAISGLNSSNSTFVSYVNDLNTYIKSKGMTTRMFNDGYKSISSGISRDIVILYWTTESVNAQTLIDAGHPVVNLNCHAGLYYAYCSGINSAYVWNQDVDKIYAGWNPGVTSCKVYHWSSSSYAYTPQEWVNDYKNEEKLLGAAFAIWTDFAFNRGKNGTTIFAENYKNMMQKIYTVAERSWSTSCTDSYSTWSGKLKAAPGGLTMSGSVDGTVLPAAKKITQAVGYGYEIGAFAVTATRRTMTGITLSWTAPSAEKAVTYTVKKTVSGKTTVLAENTTSLSLDDNDARSDAVYTVIASMTENGVDLAQPVSVSVTSAGGGLPVFVQGSVAAVSVGGDISYVLDTDGIEEGTYVMVIYNTNNESSSNYYAVSSSMKNSAPYGLVTTKVTQYVDTSAKTVDISSLASDSYLWNITVSGGKYYITAANGNGTLSINGQNNVSLSGSNTALTLKTGSRTGAYYVNYSGTNGYRLDMYSDRSGYTPSNGQCLLSAWDTSGSQNHNNVYFYRQTGSASDLYKADNSSLLELIAFAEGIDSSLYSNWDALSVDSLIAAAKAASSVSEYSVIADAEAEQKAINDAGQALYDALMKLGTEMIYYGTVTVRYVDDAGLVLRSETVMRGEEGTAYTIVPETISGYLTPSSVSGVYGRNTNEEITLVYTLSTDKTALKNELDNAVEQGDYTDESYSAYTAALEAAREVYNNSRALQSEVDSALAAVVNAKANLKSALVVVSPKSIAASSNREFYQSYTGSLALDGSSSTYAWIASAQRTGDWFRVAFDDVYTVSDVTVTSSYGNDHIRSADIQVSVNGSDWTTVGTYSGSGTKTVSFGGFVDARYVRLCLTSSSDYWWVVNEISFTFGPESEYAGQLPEMPVFRLDSDGTINSGSEYVIKSSGSDYALAVSGGTLTSVTVSPDDNAVSTDNDYAVWVITKSGSGYTIRNKGSGQYLRITASGNWFWSSEATLSLSQSASVFYAEVSGTYSFYVYSGRRYYYLGLNGTVPTATSGGYQISTGFLLYLADN